MHIEHHQANIIILTDGINHRYFKIRIKWNNRNTYDSNFSVNCLFKRVKCIEWWVSLENSQSNHGTNFLKFNLKYVLIIYIFEFAPPGFFFFKFNFILFILFAFLIYCFEILTRSFRSFCYSAGKNKHYWGSPSFAVPSFKGLQAFALQPFKGPYASVLQPCKGLHTPWSSTVCSVQFTLQNRFIIYHVEKLRCTDEIVILF